MTNTVINKPRSKSSQKDENFNINSFFNRKNKHLMEKQKERSGEAGLKVSSSGSVKVYYNIDKSASAKINNKANIKHKQ